MFKPFVNCLCAMALAKAVLGQNIFIASPVVHTNVVAGSNITIQLGEIVRIGISMTSFLDASEYRPDLTESIRHERLWPLDGHPSLHVTVRVSRRLPWSGPAPLQRSVHPSVA
ncbi:hypothetical protein JVT61DRAFT_8983 [Boletus reticuloceps]|uniref:Uncharacterized protein n=1 Tax=Boletus reticuloceps TaxID=495285 RepID=A0A8I2YHP0_9AGAM|nr:hypothetical protein JVT61DRAFT_8983 [Boletus reticuloceps]